jgi:hypothetical protein
MVSLGIMGILRPGANLNKFLFFASMTFDFGKRDLNFSGDFHWIFNTDNRKRVNYECAYLFSIFIAKNINYK